jgi:tight adherence protein B
MNIALPVAIFGFGGAVAVLLVAYWDAILQGLARTIEPYISNLDRAALPVKSEDLALWLLLGTIMPWAIIEIIGRPHWAISIGVLVACFLLSFGGIRLYVHFRIAKRLAEFNNQLEMVLRLIAGTMKVGLGLRQALVSVVADMPDPSRIEFMRVVSQTQIGVSLYDALDALNQRMPSQEMRMFAAVVRLQGRTGGNLSTVLDNLAGTIKERRRLDRKMRALTAEARTSKYIITALPVFVGGFIIITEPEMRHGLIGTMVGRGIMVIVVMLLALGWYLFDRLSVIEV